MMSAAVAGPTFRPTPSYTTLRDMTAWRMTATISSIVGGSAG
jgi:hypothetical protein